MSKQEAHNVFQRLSATVVHADSGVTLKVTTTGRPHLLQLFL
jgi:hypothetical protein